MNLKKRILVAPLNWGLGHATRCIPIIRALIEHEFEPVIASDGSALELLKKEFPKLEHIELPSYNIKYSKKKKNFKLKLIKDTPKVLKAIKAEKKQVKELVKNSNIKGIISDNRMGIYSKQVPSVFLTHQLNVLSGSTTWFSSKLHQRVIKKFDICWVPDLKDAPNLSGKLGHSETFDSSLKYIGPISRFEKQDMPIKYDLLVLLSGPEPQRTLLEEKLLKELEHSNKKIVFVRGVVEGEQIQVEKGHIDIYNFMTSNELERTINESDMVLSRSGYTTIMDLAKLNKKAYFIPTPGQFEQEYLSKLLDEQGIAPSCSQDDFTIDKLDLVENYKGLKAFDYKLNYANLFGLFEGE
ncbi:glycosyltransferase [Winogradskyella sp. 3972H.M.0a.05]|uniref:glycosyltransferase n=1 Tax=Winogradskyella sp. 3972H.M.0a.05 TaxID=2950277 RepID=UPI003393A295